jgi:hypothetical protein
MTEAEVIDRINSTIKKNGKNAISGDEMNFVLKAIIQLISDAGGTVNWGDIEGTIADQLDLIALLDDKVDVVAGKELSENDFTDALKSKLDGIEGGAEVNVKADWTATSGDAEILNKPTIPNPANFVAKSDYTPAHSVLVQQSGTGSPTAVTIGTNEFLGRKSGGGSNIEGLSVSETKSILNYTASELLTALGWFSIQDQTPGTTSVLATNTISKSIALPFVPTNLKFRAVGNKTNSNGAYTIRAYLSEVDNNIGGTAILIATSTGANVAVNYLPLNRHNFDIIGGNIIGFNATSAQVVDDVNLSPVRLNTPIPTGTPLYLIFAIQCASALDTARIESVEISNF